MKLAGYLAAHKLQRNEFARLVGVHHITVTNWCTGKMIPQRSHLERITEVTAGAVTANDFFSSIASTTIVPARIGIAGIGGRMGKLLAEEIASAGATLAGGSARGDDPAVLFAASDVVIDFTHAQAAPLHAAAAVASGTPLVLGSSGLSDADEEAVRAAAQHVAIVYAANFSPGVNLMLAIVERMAASLPGAQYDAEIVEMHHRQKVDAPSGTAIALGRAVAAGRGEPLRMESGRDGHTGARGTGTVGFAALRGGQVVGEHTVLFAAGSEHVALTHRSFDRRVYATGAVRAALWVVGRPPGLYGMRDVLGM